MALPPSISTLPWRVRTVGAISAIGLATLLLACGSTDPNAAASNDAQATTTTTVSSTTAPSTTQAEVAADTTSVAPEPADTEPADTEPADTETEAAEPADTEPADTETEAVEPADTVTAFNGRAIPPTVDNVSNAAALFIEIEQQLRIDGQPEEVYAELGHTEQVLIRSIMRNPDWIEPFRADLPSDLLEVADLHIRARTELGMLHSGWTPTDNIPAWSIIDPVPLDTLVEHYKSASAESGIDWQVLAGINLIETGMGRIDGVSSAGAQGPMQFLPTTWDEVSNGGDVTDPEDAIHGAARYLVRRGGLDDIRDGLWGYNNSDHYVNAVLAYAEMITLDERALRGFYNWEIYIGSAEGTLWLPVGYNSAEVGSAKAYLADNPWAKTLS